MNLSRFWAVIFMVTASIFISAPVHAAAVKVTVNGIEITDVQISLRAGLLKLEKRGGSNSARLKMARDELVNETLMMQEAKRLGITVSTNQVNDAFLNVARNLNVSSDNLHKILRANGVNADTLKDRLRSGLAWQGVTQIAIAPRVQISDLELNQEAENKLEETMSYDFMLKEILFIIPSGSKGSTSRRTAQANQYRKSFRGCDTAIELSLSYTDAAVLNVGRRHATQLPEALAKELIGLEVGQITKPRVVDKGISMLAICSKTSARDLTFIKSGLRAESGNEKLKKEADAYLARLKERASIINL